MAILSQSGLATLRPCEESQISDGVLHFTVVMQRYIRCWWMLHCMELEGLNGGLVVPFTSARIMYQISNDLNAENPPDGLGGSMYCWNW
jgi:hypothetical protein